MCDNSRGRQTRESEIYFRNWFLNGFKAKIMELQSANFQAEKQPETTPSDQVHCQRNNDIEIIPKFAINGL